MNCLVEMWLELRLVVVNLLLVIGIVSYCVAMFLFSIYARDAFDDLKRTMLQQDRLFGNARDARKKFWKDSKVRKSARVFAILMLIGMLCFIGAVICQKGLSRDPSMPSETRPNPKALAENMAKNGGMPAKIPPENNQ